MKFFTTVALIGTASALNLQRSQEGESFEAHAERYLRDNGVTDQDFADAGVGSMEDAFVMADADDDGEVTLDEAADCLAGLGFKDGDRELIRGELEIEFHEWDTNEDGSLDMEESGWGFEDHALWWLEEKFDVTMEDFEDAHLDSVGDVFTMADGDGNGEVTALEAAEAFAAYGLIDDADIGIWADEVADEFGFYDTNTSGGVDIDEVGGEIDYEDDADFEETGLEFMFREFGVTEEDIADEGFTCLGDVFDMADADSDGEVTPEEAADALASFGLIDDADKEFWAGEIAEEFGAWNTDGGDGVTKEEVGIDGTD